MAFEEAKTPSEESVRRDTERLLNPRWEELEDYFGQPIPNAIKNLYARTELIKRRDFQITNESGKSYEIDDVHGRRTLGPRLECCQKTIPRHS
jgi:hypothetical protein